MSEILGIFGEQPQSKPDPKVTLAVLLHYLASLLEDKEETQDVDGVATEPQEIRVRPRIEPLGGS